LVVRGGQLSEHPLELGGEVFVQDTSTHDLACRTGVCGDRGIRPDIGVREVDTQNPSHVPVEDERAERP
jgi:hypothetical protein